MAVKLDVIIGGPGTILCGDLIDCPTISIVKTATYKTISMQNLFVNNELCYV